ncbi:MAG: SsrA-binding protein SmpB [Phototrophicales bacterium]|mgnify:CR=1 FL=1|nr:SsrA-binding protein SmpB [Phototrophicales bacterium]
MADGRKIIARNKKAFHEYFIEESYQAGVVLMGSEIKSIRGNRISLQEGFIQEMGGELWLMQVNIAPYEQASFFGHTDPLRPRKLLLKKKEIARIVTQLRERGYTAVPTQLYLVGGLAKVEVSIARGKKLYDKRDTLAKKDAQRDIQRALKDRYE